MNLHKSKSHNIVYCITQISTGKVYVGVHATDNLEDGYMGSGKIIKSSISKYGIEDFSKKILFDFDNIKDAIEIERRIVDKNFTASDDTYNIAIGGGYRVFFGEQNGFYGKSHSEETKKKFSENNPMHNPTIREKAKSRIKEWYRNNEVSEETRRKLSVAGTGRTHSAETRRILSELNLGKVIPLSTRDKISKANKGLLKGVRKTKEHRERISEALSGRSCPWLSEVNRNPEKIRKTADKNRGQKRTKQTRENISKSKQMYVYHTPHGTFNSERDFSSATNLSGTLLRNRCIKKTDKVLLLSNLNRAMDIDPQDKLRMVGKTWKELGWYTEPSGGSCNENC